MGKFKTTKYLKGFGMGVSLVLFLLATHRAPSRPAISKEKMQAVWLTHIGTALLHHSTVLDETLHHFSRSGYDRVYFSVYGFRGTLYPTSKTATNWLLLPPFTNPWRAAVRESRRQGLKPYAWFEFGLMLPPDDPIVKRHPHWILKTTDGKTIVDNNVWLDPANPAVQEYILSHMDDILKEKDLEGIQLDDHWAVPRAFGNRSQAVTNLTRKLYEHIKAKNPQLILSISPNPHSFALQKYNQNWLAWVRQGIADEIVLQVYRKTPADVAATVNSSGIRTASRYVPVGIGLYAGWNGAPFTSKALQDQIKTVQRQGFGYSLFCWEYVLLRQIAGFIQ
ncbi:MAG: family 10 glycosylhydrolase [Snowella sp.]|nr:family 10 glycosylhydrolase [Snowella sp.]